MHLAPTAVGVISFHESDVVDPISDRERVRSGERHNYFVKISIISNVSIGISLVSMKAACLDIGVLLACITGPIAYRVFPYQGIRAVSCTAEINISLAAIYMRGKFSKIEYKYII